MQHFNLKSKIFFSFCNITFLLLVSSAYAESCPALPDDFERFGGPTNTTQKQRHLVAKHFLCNLNLDIIPSKVLTERGIKLRYLDPENKIQNIKTALRTNNYTELYSKIFGTKEIPKYERIGIKIEEYIGNDVGIVLKANSSDVISDFRGIKSDLISARFEKTSLTFQLSSLYIVTACGELSDLNWRRLRVRADKLGWYKKNIFENVYSINCPTKILAVNPYKIIYDAHDAFNMEFKYPYEDVWDDYDISTGLIDNINAKLINQYNLTGDKIYEYRELVRFGEMTKTEMKNKIHADTKRVKKASLMLLNESENAFINIINFLNEKEVNYEFYRKFTDGLSGYY